MPSFSKVNNVEVIIRVKPVYLCHYLAVELRVGNNAQALKLGSKCFEIGRKLVLRLPPAMVNYEC